MASSNDFAWDYLESTGGRELEWPHLQDVLERYGARLVELYKGNMVASGRPASGALADSLRTVVALENGGRTVAVDLSLLEYWKYIEHGTPPHWAPIAPLKEWVVVKPLLPRPMANGKLPTPTQLAYMVQYKIAMEGTEGKNDLERSLEAVWAEMQEAIGDAISEDLAAGLEVILRRWAA